MIQFSLKFQRITDFLLQVLPTFFLFKENWIGIERDFIDKYRVIWSIIFLLSTYSLMIILSIFCIEYHLGLLYVNFL